MNHLKVFVFNVGQGDNLLIHFPDNSVGFIDLCYDGKINQSEEPPSLTYLKRNFDDKNTPEVAFFHLSHYHADHIKGMEKWLDWAADKTIRQVWLPGNLAPETVLNHLLGILKKEDAIFNFLNNHPELAGTYNKFMGQYGSGTFSKLEDFSKRHQKVTEFLNAERSLQKICDQPVEIMACCLGPSSADCIHFSKLADTEILLKLLVPKSKAIHNGNDISAILQFTIDSFAHRLFFGGDASKKQILSSLEKVLNYPEKFGGKASRQSNFFKVAHHGSKESSSQEVWEQSLPENSTVYMAISAGDKQYGHPHLETLQHINNVAKTKQTSARIVATNAHSLNDTTKQDYLYNCDHIRHINWPVHKQAPLQKEKEDAFDKGFDHTGQDVKKVESLKHMPLGYCFEFDLYEEGNVSVYKLMPDL